MLLNIARAKEYMRACGLDVLVAASPVNITYFTDYHSWQDTIFKEYMFTPGGSSNLIQGYAVLPLDGEPALVVSALAAVNAADSWVKDVRIYGDPGADFSLPAMPLPDNLRRFDDLIRSSHLPATSTDAVLDILKARGLTGARIGLDMEGLTPPAKDAILSAVSGAQVKNCSNLLRLVRAVKSQEEIDRLTHAAEISETAAMEAFALARPGRSMLDLSQHYRARIGEMGADLDHFSFGVYGIGFSTEADHILTDNDLLEVDFGVIYRLYFSDTGTTLSMREPSALVLERHAALRECLDAGAAAMVPGVKGSAVRNAMWAVLQSHGISASYPHGHGYGLEVRDYPILVADNGLRIRDDCIDLPSDLPLEVNMVLNLEAAIRTPAVGSIHIERAYLVTPQGSRPLVAQDRSRPLVPAGIAG